MCLHGLALPFLSEDCVLASSFCNENVLLLNGIMLVIFLGSYLRFVFLCDFEHVKIFEMVVIIIIFL